MNVVESAQAEPRKHRVWGSGVRVTHLVCRVNLLITVAACEAGISVTLLWVLITCCEQGAKLRLEKSFNEGEAVGSDLLKWAGTFPKQVRVAGLS